jgi:hypothetical protein
MTRTSLNIIVMVDHWIRITVAEIHDTLTVIWIGLIAADGISLTLEHDNLTVAIMIRDMLILTWTSWTVEDMIVVTRSGTTFVTTEILTQAQRIIHRLDPAVGILMNSSQIEYLTLECPPPRRVPLVNHLLLVQVVVCLDYGSSRWD